MNYPILKNYIITRRYADNYHIQGYISNDNRFADDTYVTTSRILNVEKHKENYLIITQNTTYLCNVNELSKNGYYTVQDVIGELS